MGKCPFKRPVKVVIIGSWSKNRRTSRVVKTQDNVSISVGMKAAKAEWLRDIINAAIQRESEGGKSADPGCEK